MGMAAYKRNTGSDYPLSGATKTSRKRSTGSVPLTDASNYLWYGTIEVGTPPKAFEGMIFPFAFNSCRLTQGLVQCSSTLAAATSFYQLRIAHQTVMGTRCMTHLPARPRTISESNSNLLTKVPKVPL